VCDPYRNGKGGKEKKNDIILPFYTIPPSLPKFRDSPRGKEVEPVGKKVIYLFLERKDY